MLLVGLYPEPLHENYLSGGRARKGKRARAKFGKESLLFVSGWLTLQWLFVIIVRRAGGTGNPQMYVPDLRRYSIYPLGASSNIVSEQTRGNLQRRERLRH